jgi:hypothetical protein
VGYVQFTIAENPISPASRHPAICRAGNSLTTAQPEGECQKLDIQIRHPDGMIIFRSRHA